MKRKNNPLDPGAWATEKHRFDMPGETAAERLGVHTTTGFDIAVAYAVHKASQEGDLEDGEPNCGVVLTLDMSELTPLPEADAAVAAREGNEIILSMIGDVLDAFDLERDDPAAIASAVYGWTENLDHQSDGILTRWWDAYWEDVIGHQDLDKMLSKLRDLAERHPELLVAVLRQALIDKAFPQELWAESIEQYRYMVPVSYGRLVMVSVVRPVQDELADPEDTDDDDPDKPQTMSWDWLEPETVEIWSDVREPQFSLWPKSRERIEFHGTDVSRARAAFPEIAKIIRCLWPCGQPEGVGP